MNSEEGSNKIEEDKNDNEEDNCDNGQFEFEVAGQEARAPAAKAVAEAQAVALDESEFEDAEQSARAPAAKTIAVTSARESYLGGWLWPVGSGMDSAQFKA